VREEGLALRPMDEKGAVNLVRVQGKRGKKRKLEKRR
jgi:hypothetical protein